MKQRLLAPGLTSLLETTSWRSPPRSLMLTGLPLASMLAPPPQQGSLRGVVTQAAVRGARMAQLVQPTRDTPIIHQAATSQIAEHSQHQERQRGVQQPQRGSQRPQDTARNRQKANGTAPSPAAARESREGLRAGSVGAAASGQLKDAFVRTEKRPVQATEWPSRPYTSPSAAIQPGLPQAGTSPATRGTSANWNGRWGQTRRHRRAPASLAAPDGACSAAIWQRTQSKAPAGVPGRDRVGPKRGDAPQQHRTRHLPAAQGVAQVAAAQGTPADKQRPTAAPAATAKAVALHQHLQGAAGPQAAGTWQNLDSAERCAEPVPMGQESLAAGGGHQSLAAGAVRDTSQPVSSRKAASAHPDQEAEASPVSPHSAYVTAQGSGSSSRAAGKSYPEGALPAKMAALLSAADTAAAEADAQALALEQALEMVENQLPQWAHQQNLDRGATAGFEPMAPLVPSLSSLGVARQIVLKDQQLPVQPLWIAVHQEEDGGTASLYESICPLDSAVIEQLRTPLEPLLEVEGLNFNRSDAQHGAWRNYFMGVVGSVAAAEEDVLWPNQLLRGSRVMHNVRNGTDIARFLADASQEHMQEHLDNLRRLQEARQYRPGWCWHMLRNRWGPEALQQYQLDGLDAEQPQQAVSAVADTSPPQT